MDGSVTGANGIPPPLKTPGLSVDIDRQTTDDDLEVIREVQSYLDGLPPIKRKRIKPLLASSAPQLPVGCVGAACLLRDIIKRAGEVVAQGEIDEETRLAENRAFASERQRDIASVRTQ